MRRSTMDWLLLAGLAVLCAATVSIPGWAKAGHRQPTAIPTLRMPRGTRRDAPSRGDTEQWDITVTRADATMLEGHVTRHGPTSLQGGRLRGTIAGQRVTGNVTDGSGEPVATFVGTITRSGAIHGSYHDRGGASGRWSWDGPLFR